MKVYKKMLTVLAAFAGSFVFCSAPVFALDNYVEDDYGLFSVDEEAAINEKCAAFTESNDITAFVLTVGNDEAGGSSESDTQQYIEDYSDQNIGGDAIGLIINMDIRYYYVDVTGDQALRIYSDRRQDEIGGAVAAELSDGDYAAAAETFVDKADEMVSRAAAEGYSDYDSQTAAAAAEEAGGAGRVTGVLTDAVNYIVPAVLALIVTLIIFFVKRSKHREIRAAVNADMYVAPRSFQLQSRSDIMVNQYTTRTPKHVDNGGSRGGGGGGGHVSVHTSSGGHSHSGSGGHF